MARKIFSSFHYKPDNWRASKVRNIGKIEGNPLASDNDWESVTSGGTGSIKKWIDKQMKGRSCVVVLVGFSTAERKWVQYEIEKGWNDAKGIVGIHIHNITDRDGKQSSKGSNPFRNLTVGTDKKKLSNIVKCYDPPYTTSKYVYDHIEKNIITWIEEAIEIRSKY